MGRTDAGAAGGHGAGVKARRVARDVATAALLVAVGVLMATAVAYVLRVHAGLAQTDALVIGYGGVILAAVYSRR